MDFLANEKCSFWQTEQSQTLLCYVCYLSYLVKQAPEFHWVTTWVKLGLWINSWSKDKAHFMVKSLVTPLCLGSELICVSFPEE